MDGPRLGAAGLAYHTAEALLEGRQPVLDGFASGLGRKSGRNGPNLPVGIAYIVR